MVHPMHPLGRVAWHPARVAVGDIGAAGLMRRLSLRVVVESAEVILVLVVVIASETVMEDGLGMRGIGVRRILGESRRLREHRGVIGIVDQEIDGRCLGLVLALVRHRREGGGKFDSLVLRT